jgi:hypothetical protein
MKPKTTPKLPMRRRRRRWPLSKMGPVQAPTKRTHTDLEEMLVGRWMWEGGSGDDGTYCIDPIQEMLEEVSWNSAPLS